MNIRDIYFAGGCFWGTEKYFKLIQGVVGTEVGYANGNTGNPTYEQVYTDTTGYAECVHVRYDADSTSLRRLTQMFFKAIDPTSLNRQGEDSGTRYRTGAYFVSPDDEAVLRGVFDEQTRLYGILAVELLPLKNFVRAEDYHQDYLDKNPGGYCHLGQELFEFAKNSTVMKQVDLSVLGKENPFELIGEQWMLITAGSKDSFNTMTASWGGLGWLWNRPVAFIFVRPERFTHDFLESSDKVTLSFYPESCRGALQICGTKSGRDCDKVKEAGLTPVVLESGAVSFRQARLTAECRKLFKSDMEEADFIDKEVLNKWYGEAGLHSVYVLEIERIWE